MESAATCGLHFSWSLSLVCHRCSPHHRVITFPVATAAPQFNLVNPQERNTVAVPTGGWAVIRFVANNPGMWFMHCHFEAHLDLGLAMVFEVQDGPTPDTSLPPPPADLPQC
ncbi:hypothetical protein GUJ93_ZPchr0009g2075 [Zizania palustris]|uniref:Plastocyanin-like domain-containing protein n=1 Tax=Zizania palustris TaxID=103762 RepID=A0A8J5R4B8_ZIZPA|nr:hypothetical protein GUJ93_ZPchr0009g2075 [Zizania palustris]